MIMVILVLLPAKLNNIAIYQSWHPPQTASTSVIKIATLDERFTAHGTDIYNAIAL
jgi:hypothetical protein